MPTILASTILQSNLPQGLQGIQGTSGYVGSDGAQGAKGDTGAQGIAGSQGASGEAVVSSYVFDCGYPSTNYIIGPAFDCGGVT